MANELSREDQLRVEALRLSAQIIQVQLERGWKFNGTSSPSNGSGVNSAIVTSAAKFEAYLLGKKGKPAL